VAALVVAGCGGDAAAVSEGDGPSSSSSGGNGGASSSTSTASGAAGSSNTMELPDEVGSGVETGYEQPTSCCTRRTRTVNRSCPPGTNASAEGSFVSAGDSVELSGTLNTQLAVAVQALVTPDNGEVTLTLSETNDPPPAGVLDLSPVFVVESDVRLPPMALQIPLTSNQWSFPLKGAGVYFSTDNTHFTLLEDSSMNAGFMLATLQGAGFFFAGSVASESECGNL